MTRQLLKQQLRRWPKIFMSLVSLKRGLMRFWGWERLVPYRWRNYPDLAFHNDQVLRALVGELIREFQPTALVETGTFKAATALFLARLAAGRIPVYTCEISPFYFRESQWRLREMSGVTLQRLSSPTFLNQLVEQRVLGARPLFFLDAHSGGGMVLKEELQALSALPQAIVIIDDFLVPGHNNFRYDIHIHDLTEERQPLDFRRIKGVLNPHHHYRFLFPHYSAEEAFLTDQVHDDLVGYVVILVNLENEWQDWRRKSRLPPFYQEHKYHA